jgi:prolipoprotein diacylglyceryl transferase
VSFLLASIPSPSNGTIDLGPIPLHVYGVLLAIGVVVATAVTMRRWRRWGHDPHDVENIAVVVVIAGVVGARLYHVATDYDKFEGHWLRVFEIWKGGLSIWGVVIGGIIAVVVMCRVRHYDTLGLMDAIAPGLLAAQAIGRWGNYFNQELFGEPTKLPWGLEIDPAKRPPGFTQYATFHPTFLYESIYCVALIGLLLWAERRWRLKRGQLGALYVMTYTFGRFWLENLRIDDAKVVFGLRVNAWVSLLAFAGGGVWFWWLGRHSTVDERKYEAIAPAPA